MNDFTKIIDNYKEVSPCLLKISENIKNFQRIEHSVIFTYLFCYFSKKNISVEDLSTIFNLYLIQITFLIILKKYPLFFLIISLKKMIHPILKKVRTI